MSVPPRITLQIVLGTVAAYFLAFLFFAIAFAGGDLGRPWYFWAGYGLLASVLALVMSVLTWMVAKSEDKSE